MDVQRLPTEAILRILENGEWHYIKDIPKLTTLNSAAVEYVTKFLAKYDFVTIDKTQQKIKLDPPTTVFLKKIRQIEHEEKL